ncbi:fumarylacetoacetate hydrolase family protein [Alicyclobacillus herbarius]|uniref:fumarylacetoacetate hydrolase family protein n=1 Tax=Alicyclobacillus herbarius TaxID=122960 RepID=UPI000406900A|nr:fumarylacetoacetate hydrolase family protein [Alicyclobacillus herbarius]
MRLVRFQAENEVKLGVVLDSEKILDVTRVMKSANRGIVYHDVLAVIKDGQTGLSLVEEAAKNFDPDFVIHAQDVKILAPYLPERNVFCLGKNYVAHAKEFDGRNDDSAIPNQPIIFTKPPSSVVATQESVYSYPELTSELDYEAEIAVIIGTEGINIEPEESWNYVFGFSLINDLTARDLQKKHQQWFKGKSLDGFCPFGPCVVTMNDIASVNDIDVYCLVNGEERQRSSLKQLIFDIPQIISVLSRGMRLQAGDIIATGTPEGVGMGYTPPRFLKPGDVVTVGSSQIGELVNTII